MKAAAELGSFPRRSLEQNLESWRIPTERYREGKALINATRQKA